MKNKIILIGLVILSSAAFFFTACKKENISEQDHAALEKEVKNSTIDPDVIAFNKALQKYRRSVSETFKANNITAEKFLTAVSTGETLEIDKIIFESDIVKNLEAMQPYFENQEIDNGECGSCPSEEYFENYVPQEKDVVILNNLLMANESVAQRDDEFGFCQQPEFFNCATFCYKKYNQCMNTIGIGNNPLGGSLCLLYSEICVGGCIARWCVGGTGGGTEPECPGCPVETGGG